MKLEWDDVKNENNIRRHGLDFADAWQLFENPLLVDLDVREDYGEDRWVGIGLLKSAAIVAVVVFAERGPDTLRIISLRKATKHEKERYEKALKD